MQAWLRKLLQWRKTARVVHDGQLMHFVPENGSYVLFRYDERDTVMLILNKNSTATRLATARFSERLPTGARMLDVLTGQTVTVGPVLEVPARSVTLFQLERPLPGSQNTPRLGR
jgi:hypothetical protein